MSKDITNLLRDYLKENGGLMYGDDGVLEVIKCAGNDIVYVERSDCGHYKDTRMIELLDIVAWVYCKQFT